MKKFSPLILIALVANFVFAQTGAVSYKWRATAKVVDEDSNPISGATVDVGYYNNSQPVDAKGITDANGIFTFSHVALSTLVEVGVQAEKDGYYFARMGRTLPQNYDPSQWYFTQTLVLKKVGHPIAMYAKWVRSEPPEFKKTGRPPVIFKKTIGYDLMAGDWVAPYGKGVNTDLNFTEEFNKQSTADFDYKLTVNFPKPGDGIQEFIVPDAEKGSGLRSPNEAPANGYQAQLIRENVRHPGQSGKSDYDPNRNYFFRVRTAIDDRGNIVSAHYGKIYGDFMQFSYYLNPTPNSRNIEFDGKHNLLCGLQSFEQVTEP